MFQWLLLFIGTAHANCNVPYNWNSPSCGSFNSDSKWISNNLMGACQCGTCSTIETTMVASSTLCYEGSEVSPCIPNPCAFEGKCTHNGTEFFCECGDNHAGNWCHECKTGYDGFWCDHNIDDCLHEPCHNGGTCHDDVNSYTCECAPGYTGTHCNHEIDECQPNPCHNGGTCEDRIDDFLCNCPTGWDGKTCDNNIDDCVHNNCLNGGICIDAHNSFTCQCLAGFNGDHCENNIDDCYGNPCHNAGVCTDGIDSYSCKCSDGFEGKDCELDKDDCSPDACQHEGVCTDLLDSFVCDCEIGYIGPKCEIDVDECSQTPCQNGGACTDGAGKHTCHCIDGFEGIHCEKNINDCVPSACSEHGECSDGINKYTCDCHVGWKGETCSEPAREILSQTFEFTHIQTLDSITEPQNVLKIKQAIHSMLGVPEEWVHIIVNHTSLEPPKSFFKRTSGKCDDENGWGYIQSHSECLTARDHFFPDATETIINEGTWVNGVTNCALYVPSDNVYYNYGGTPQCGTTTNCICVTTSSGRRRLYGTIVIEYEIRIPLEDDASKVALEMQALEPQTLSTAFLTTVSDLTSNSVDSLRESLAIVPLRIDNCAPGPCKNSGVCHDKQTHFICECILGFMGDQCQINIDDCAAAPCIHGGCQDKINSYTCFCEEGYSGTNCDQNIDDCIYHPCKHGGECVDDIRSFTCNCVEGFEGLDCSTKINYCEPDPCKHGTCIDQSQGYTCDCDSGFVGQICDQNIDECQDNPCHNGGTCIDGINSFTCECQTGYSGDQCDTNIDDCQPHPCNHGTCKDDINSFSCVCDSGYMGELCNQPTNPCLLEPCDPEHALCIHLGPGSFNCECDTGYETNNNGKICTNKDDCESDSCNGHGICKDLIDAFECECQDGWVGLTCDIDPAIKCDLGEYKDNIHGCSKCPEGKGPFPLLSEDATSCVDYSFDKNRCIQLTKNFEDEQCEITCANPLCGRTKYEHDKRECC